MKKTLKRILALVLVLCSVLSYTAPAVSAWSWDDFWNDITGGGNTEDTVTYNFDLYSQYQGVPILTNASGTKEYKGVFYQTLLGNLGTSTYDSIPDRFANGDMNWTYETASSGVRGTTGDLEHMPNVDSRFTSAYGFRSVIKLDQWMALRIKSPGAGTYGMKLQYTAFAGSGTVAFYILPAEGSASIDKDTVLTRAATIESTLHPEYRVGTVKMSEGTLENKNNEAVIGGYEFEAEKDYILVMKNQEASSSGGTAYVALTNLTMVPGEIEDDSQTTSTDIKAVTAQKNVVPASDNGGVAAVWEVDGHDYYFLPLEGGKMMIFDLDTWEPVKSVDTGVHYPTCATVTNDGKMIISGNTAKMFVFDINTMRGTLTANFKEFGFSGMIQDVYAADDGYIYLSAFSAGAIGRYDLEEKKFEYFTDIIDPAVRQQFGITTAANDKGDVDGNVEGLAVHNGYFYAKAASANYVVIAKYDIANKQLVGMVDVTEQLIKGSPKGLAILGNEYLLAAADGDNTSLALINLNSWSVVKENSSDYNALFKTSAAKNVWNNGASSTMLKAVDGKLFFFGNSCGLFYYEESTQQIKRLRTGSNGNFNVVGNPTVTMMLSGDTAETDYLMTFASGGEPRFYKPTVGSKIAKSEKLMKTEYGTGGSPVKLNTADSNKLYIGAWNNFGAAVYDTTLEEISQRYYTAGQTDSQLVYNGQLYAGNYSATVVTKINMDVEEQTEFVISDIKQYQQERIHTLAAGNDHIFCGTIPKKLDWGGAVVAYNMNEGTQKLLSFRCQAVNGEKTIGCEGATTGEHHPLCNLAVNGVVYEETNDVILGATTRNGGTTVGYSEGTSAHIFALDYQNMEILATLDLRTTDLGLATDTIDYIGGLTIDPNVDGRVWGIVSDVLFYFTYNKDAGTFDITKVLDMGSSNYPTNSNVALFNRQVIFDTENDQMYVALYTNGMRCITVNDLTADTVEVVSNQKILTETPEFYALGTDITGKTMLYYTVNTDLKAYPVNVDDADWAAAKVVDDMIAAIGTVTADKADDIVAARAAYEALPLRHKALVQNQLTLPEDEALVLEMQIANVIETPLINDLGTMGDYVLAYNSLTDTQKAYVRNYDTLVNTYDAVLDIAQNTNAGAVQDAINELTDITLQDEAKVNAARQAYDALSDEHKVYVDATNLTAAEARLAALAGAKDVQELIDALPDPVSKSDAQQVADIRAAYEALTDDEKASVNLTKLETAEAQLAEIAQAEEVQAQIDALTDITLDDESTVAAARNAYNELSDFAKNLVNTDKLVASEKKIEDLKTAQVVEQKIHALPDEVVITDIGLVKSVRAAYEALSEEIQAQVDTAKLIAAEEVLEDIANKAVPTTLTYDFELYNNSVFFNDFTNSKYPHTAGYVNSSFSAGVGYNSTYATVADWFYASYPSVINWGIETSSNGAATDYVFRGNSTTQGMRMLATSVGSYGSLRIFVPVAGLYTIDLTAGNVANIFDMYVIPAETYYTDVRTSASVIEAAMVEENLLINNLTTVIDQPAAVGQWNFPEAGEYILIFKAEKAVSNGISLRNMTLTPVVNAETAAAVVGDQYFLSVADALVYQAENGADCVTLNKDVQVEYLHLESNQILDLNGHTLTVDSIKSYASSGIIDSSEKSTGVLVVKDEDGLMLDENNSQLPIYDAAEGGYRFFEISVKSVAITGKDGGNAKYWFKVSCENFDEIYKLIQAGSELNKLNITVRMTWNGGEATATADPALLNQWAAKYAVSGDNFYITVTAVNAEGFEDFPLLPCFEANGVASKGKEMN